MIRNPLLDHDLFDLFDFLIALHLAQTLQPVAALIQHLTSVALPQLCFKRINLALHLLARGFHPVLDFDFRNRQILPDLLGKPQRIGTRGWVVVQLFGEQCQFPDVAIGEVFE